MVVIYIINAIVNAVLFGVFVEQFEIVRRKELGQQKEIDESNTVMSHLPIVDGLEDVKDDVRNYLLRTFTTKAQ